MAKTKVSEYDSTAANNTDIDSINIAEGMAPSNVNNAIRELMAHLKDMVFKTGTANTSLGDGALDSLDGSSPGGSNVAIGKDAGTALTTGGNNVAVGFEALKTEDGDSNTVAVGYQALATQNAGSDSGNTGIGTQAGTALSTGQLNTFVGRKAGAAITTHSNNVAIGAYAMDAGVGDHNIAIGSGALGGASLASGDNVAIGTDTLNALTSGTENVCIGRDAGKALMTGSHNTVLGNDALVTEDGHGKNVAIGWSTLKNLNCGVTGLDGQNVAVGYDAGRNTNIGVFNTFVGCEAGQANTSGDANTFIGKGSGSAVTTGDNNTIIGCFNGNQGNLDIRTSDKNIVLSDGNGNPRGYWHGGLTSPKWVFDNPTSGQTAMQIRNSGSPSPFGVAIKFENAAPDNNTQYFLDCSDNSATRARIESDGDFQSADNSFGSLSDEKLKENIADANSQWDDIKAVRVRKFSMKSHNSDTANRIGVIAQELEAAGMSGLVKDCPDLIQDGDTITESDTTTKSVKYSILYMKAIKALQEAMTRIETLETKVAALEAE